MNIDKLNETLLAFGDGGVDKETINEDINKYVESEVKNATLRIAADFENFKKRTARERENTVSDLKFKVAKPFLEVFEDLERIPVSDLSDGISLIIHKYRKIIESLGITEVPCVGKYNVDLHECISMIDNDTLESNDIATVVNKGWMIGDKILTYPKVVVVK